jgi:phospholipid N-methyltransferase
MLQKYGLAVNASSDQAPNSTSLDYPAKELLKHLASSEKTARRIVSRFEKFLNHPILEVGGGLGQITNELLKTKGDVTSLEPDPVLFEILRTKYSQRVLLNVSQTTVGDFVDEPGVKAQFGSAVYVNVLEHIENDLDELTKTHELLVTGGKLVIFSPALPILYGSMDGLSQHFRRYSKTSLISTIEKAGYKVIHAEYFDFVGIVPYFIMYRLLKIRSIGGGGMFIYDHLILPISTQLSKLSRGKLIGKNLLVVGEKIEKKEH